MNTVISLSCRRVCSLLCTVAAVLFLSSCEPTIDTPLGTGALGDLVPSGQSLKYVAIGNSLTAGYQSGALYGEAQQYAWTVQLAKQLGMTDFQYPQFENAGISIDGRLYFAGFDATGNPILQRGSSIPLGIASNASLNRPFNNLGVPGAFSFDVFDSTLIGKLGYNPFFTAVLRDKQFGASQLQQALAQQPNVITLWIGNNDVLYYAASGGTGTLPLPGGEGPTPIAIFEQAYSTIVNALLTNAPNSKIVVATIPDVSATPLFTTITSIPLTRQGQVDSLTAGYAPLNALLKRANKDTFSFALGANRIIIDDPAAPGGRRYAEKNEYILLSASDSMKVGHGTAIPLGNRYVLTAAEYDIVKRHTDAYNTTIRNIVAANSGRMALVDINTIFNDIAKNGYTIPGSSPLKRDFISGGIFSLDGIHPSNKGATLVANEFIKVINAKWHSDIALINPNNVPGLKVEHAP